MNSYRHTPIGWPVLVPVLFVLGAAVSTLSFVPQARGVLHYVQSIQD